MIEDYDYKQSPIPLEEDEQAKENPKSLVECVQRLISAKDIRTAITAILETILDFYQGERAYIFDIDEEAGIINNTYEVCKPGVSEEIDNLQDVPLDFIHAWMNYFVEGKNIYIEDLDQLPDSRKDEYETLKAQGIRSLMTVPLYIDDKLDGFLGVDDPALFSDDPKFLTQLTYFICSEVGRRRNQEKLEFISYHDALTGLYNRHRFRIFTEEHQYKALKAVGIAFFDINGLKHINDNYGHDVGDKAIVEVAQAMVRHFPNATHFRFSGDEFIVIDENSIKAEFVRSIGILNDDLLEKGTCGVTGGVVWEDRITDVNSSLIQADKLMYINKQKYYADGVTTAYQNPNFLETLLQQLEDGQYVMYLQPQCELKTQRVTGAEALVRLNDPQHGIMTPFQFIGILEKQYIIQYLDYFMFESVCALIRRWQDEGRPTMHLSVNLSRITLMEDDVLSRLLGICVMYNVSPKLVILEVTESEDTIDDTRLQSLCAEFRQQGFKLSMDDFGSSYSNLAMIADYPIDYVKLDMDLVQGISHDIKRRVIVAHIVSAFQELGLPVLAEGVETEEDRAVLETQGCDFYQGYLKGKPMPVDEFEMRFMGED